MLKERLNYLFIESNIIKLLSYIEVHRGIAPQNRDKNIKEMCQVVKK